MTKLVEFLNEAAKYFEGRDTKGEDIAFWSNVVNAENCRKAATEIATLRKALTKLVRECEAEFTVDGKWSDTGQLVQKSTFKTANLALKRNA